MSFFYPNILDLINNLYNNLFYYLVPLTKLNSSKKFLPLVEMTKMMRVVISTGCYGMI